MLKALAISVAAPLFAVSALFCQEGDMETDFPVVDEATYNVFVEFYQYDRNLPLDADIIEAGEEEDYSFEKITFKSVHDQFVPAILALPKEGKGPFPCVFTSMISDV